MCTCLVNFNYWCNLVNNKTKQVVRLVKDALTKHLEPACGLYQRLTEMHIQCDFLTRPDCYLTTVIHKTVL